MTFKDISQEILNSYPFEHLLVDDYASPNYLSSLQDDIKKLEQTQPDNVFKSQFGEKKEWKNCPKELIVLQNFLDHMSSETLLKQIKLLFGIDSKIEIYPDLTYDGGGYVISPPQSYLSYHADFNFSNQIKKFRSFNILFYVNEDYSESGGCLHLLDSSSKTVEKIVKPQLNRFIIFKTDDVSFHGVSRNERNFYRRSFNFYYYTNEPLSSLQSENPHKTIWMDFKHDH
jgi:hypothetical protein